ncbi:MAG TPA: metal ABC transporter ATP-binding protein [Terriglobales bacterium]|nr:metal ABC transporter ATP-binding protein [Terriglobales bacterium]
MAEVLAVTALKVVADGRTLVGEVSFSVEAGECLAIIGPNGAGKTVLLRALLGLMPYSGEIRWAPGTRLGYVPQKIEADRRLPIHFGNLLAAKAALIGASQAEREAVIEEVGLDARLLATPVGKLSGGQFQRALLAFALLGRPQVLLLDEPTASIDQPGEERMYELIHRLQQGGLTVILISHELSVVYGYANRVLCLNRTALCIGPPREIMTPEALEQLYGAPARFYHTEHERHA